MFELAKRAVSHAARLAAWHTCRRGVELAPDAPDPEPAGCALTVSNARSHGRRAVRRKG